VEHTHSAGDRSGPSPAGSDASRRRRIVLTGILGWGLPMAAFMASTRAREHPDGAVIHHALVALVVCSAGGWLFGVLAWKQVEKRRRLAATRGRD
jgi:hypothetical protein